MAGTRTLSSKDIHSSNHCSDVVACFVSMIDNESINYTHRRAITQGYIVLKLKRTTVHEYILS